MTPQPTRLVLLTTDQIEVAIVPASIVVRIGVEAVALLPEDAAHLRRQLDDALGALGRLSVDRPPPAAERDEPGIEQSPTVEPDEYDADGGTA